MDGYLGRVQRRVSLRAGERERIDIRADDKSRTSSASDAGKHSSPRSHIEHSFGPMLPAKHVEHSRTKSRRRMRTVAEHDTEASSDRQLRKAQPALRRLRCLRIG